MKKLFRVAAATCIGLLMGVASAASRTSEPINRDWTFTLGNPQGAQAIAYDTSQWQRVDVPHSMSQPYFLGTGFYDQIYLGTSAPPASGF